METLLTIIIVMLGCIFWNIRVYGELYVSEITRQREAQHQVDAFLRQALDNAGK